MYLFKNVSSLSVKLINNDKKCIWSCLRCFESQNIQSKWFNHLSLVNEFLTSIENKHLLNLKELDAINFYWSSIFDLFSIKEIEDFLYKNKELNFKVQVNLNNLDFLNSFKSIEDYKIFFNVSFFLFKSYENNLDLELLKTYIDFFNNNSLKYEVDISINTDFNDINDIKRKLWNNINIRENIIIKDNNVSNLQECSIVNSFFVTKDNIILRTWEYKSLLLDFIPNWDIQTHNLPCHWWAITISNINKDRNEILKDFLKFKFFLNKYLNNWSSSFWKKCYNCFNKIKYNYRKY